MKRPRKREEAELQQAGSDLLRLDGWRMLRTDPVSDRAAVMESRRRLHQAGASAEFIALVRSRGKGFGEVGMADCLYIRYKHNGTKIPELYLPWAEVLWIEWKAPRGRLSEHQRHWQDVERARGALVLTAGVDFAADLDSFIDWYVQDSGLARTTFNVRKSGKGEK